MILYILLIVLFFVVLAGLIIVFVRLHASEQAALRSQRDKPDENA